MVPRLTRIGGGWKLSNSTLEFPGRAGQLPSDTRFFTSILRPIDVVDPYW